MNPINPLIRYSFPYPSSPDLTWTELQDKNNATHIPPEEFQELVSFLQTHSPETATAIEEGSLLEQTELDLSSKGLTQLPNSLRHLTNLTKLDVSLNQLTVLPDEIRQLTNLTKLDVSANQLTVLPDTIGQLTNLTKLDVYNNQLAALPDTIGQLTNLTKLDVYNNQLAALPDTIGQLTNLTELHVHYNQLTALPDTIGQLTNLTELHVHYNQLTVLPDTIGGLSLLKVLQICGNRDLSILPLSLGNCSQLTDLSITGTKIPSPSCDRILRMCSSLHDLELAEKLPNKIKLWRGFAGVVREWTDPEFTEKQKRRLYEWLLCLEKAEHFRGNQKELAKKTCAILETVYTDAKFRETFFSLITEDHTACGDRAAMSLNLVYTDWRLYTLPAEASRSEKVQLLVGCGRAQKLRNLLLSRYPGSENIEKVLYAEANLRERLGLVTAIYTILFSQIEHVQESVLEEIAHEIEAIPVVELVREFDDRKKYLKEHRDPSRSSSLNDE
ncbi:MAG: hypothetical protein SP4CHLAM17_02470 [Chlamydiales bacterium]|nr:hypothetical protein [Chlamydiales bacterium]